MRRAVARAPDGQTAADAALALFGLATVAATSPGGSEARALPEALEALASAIGRHPAAGRGGGARGGALSAMAAVSVGRPREPQCGADPGDTPSAQAKLALLPLHDRRARRRRQDGGRITDRDRARAGGRRRTSACPAEAPYRSSREPRRARGWAAPRPRRRSPSPSGRRRIRPRWRRPSPICRSPGPRPGPSARPDPRRSRARRTGGALGVALHLEAALDAERQGELGAALAAYGSVIALDPDRLEAWTGVRRVARAGGDLLGEARALARLGVLVREPRRAAALLAEAASAYESAGRDDDAIAVLSRAVELCPDDAGRLRAGPRAPPSGSGGARAGRHLRWPPVVSAGGRDADDGRADRAAVRARAASADPWLEDRPAAFHDFKQILKISPNDLAALHELARGALAEQDPRAAAPWLERYLAAAGVDEPELVAAAKLDLAACYEAVGEPGRAIETLRQAARARPGDPTPFEHLAELQLRRQDPTRGGRRAPGSRRTSRRRPRAGSAGVERSGRSSATVARDPSAAAAAFRQAADSDPLGEGAATLVSLHDAAGDARGALEVVEREIADLQARTRRPSARRASAGAARAMAGRRAPPWQRWRRR